MKPTSGNKLQYARATSSSSSSCLLAAAAAAVQKVITKMTRNREIMVVSFVTRNHECDSLFPTRVRSMDFV